MDRVRRLTAICLSFLVFVSLSAAAQADKVDGRAAKVFHAWLAAFNSGDAAMQKAFDETYKPRRSISEMAGFRKQTGGFDLMRVELSEPTHFVALMKEKNSENMGRLDMTVSAEDPPVMQNFSMNLVPTPPDLAPQRLSESEALSSYQQMIGEAVKAEKFSGAALVARNGKVLLEKAWGMADREKNVPATVDSQFRMGSMNKMFTAVAVMQLVGAGKISLDGTVGTYLPDYPNKDIADKVRIRHLLTHTGGTGDFMGPEYDRERLNMKTHGDYVKLLGARAPEFAPGAQSRYSNYGFVLLGAIIERVSGMSYYDYVREHVYKPAGMTSTDSLPETEAVAKRTRGYMKRDSQWVPNTETLPWRGNAAGGGYTTVGDMLRFAMALQEGKLLSPALLAQATQAQTQGYGFGFGVRGSGDWQYFGHNGGAPGQNAEFRVFPKLGYVLVTLSNIDPPSATRAIDYINARLPV